MHPTESGLTKSRIKKLRELLGIEWVETLLSDHEDFRLRSSPAGLWSHRHPSISPIAPLLFQYRQPGYTEEQTIPYGYWYGEPLKMLAEITDAIYAFEDYWSKIPRPLLADHMRYKLSTGELFNSFIFEMMVANDIQQRYKGYNFHPLFFDPATPKGAPEIVLRKGSDVIEVHCRSSSPVSLQGFSLDLLQYLFGCFCRFVHDSGYSYKLSLTLKQSIELAYVDGLLNQISSIIAAGSEGLRDSGSPLYDVELLKMDVPRDGMTSTEVNSLLAKDAGNLFVQIGASCGSGERNATSIAVLSVSSSRYRPFSDCILDVVRQAAAGIGSRNSHIVAAHLTRYAGWGDYLRQSSNRLKVRQGLDSILREHTNIRYVNVSSNRPEFVVLPSDAQRVDTQDLEVSNRYFIEAKPKLYIRKHSFALYPYPEDEGEDTGEDEEEGEEEEE